VFAHFEMFENEFGVGAIRKGTRKGSCAGGNVIPQGFSFSAAKLSAMCGMLALGSMMKKKKATSIFCNGKGVVGVDGLRLLHHF
jgi:hypothetical protein